MTAEPLNQAQGSSEAESQHDNYVAVKPAQSGELVTTQVTVAHSQSFRFSKPGMKPKNLHS